MQSFPSPLTPSEEKYYIQKYTEGDLEAKHILIERNLRLVAHVIKKYQNLEEDPEDLISIGTIGLIKAVVTFNPNKGNRLAAYASRCIENEILMHLRSKRKSSKEISLYEPIGTDREGNEIKLYDIIETDEVDVPEKIHLKENIQKLYEKVENELSPREKLVLKMRYGLYSGEEYTQREIARQTWYFPFLRIQNRKKCNSEAKGSFRRRIKIRVCFRNSNERTFPFAVTPIQIFEVKRAGMAMQFPFFLRQLYI